MLSLIVTFLFALAVAYFAIQNTYNVPVTVANNVFESIPLYFVIIASVLTGIILASLISSMDMFSAYMKLRGKDHEILEDEKTINSLQEKVHELEVENTRLKADVDHDVNEPEVVEETRKSESHRPTFIHRAFHPRT